MVADDRSRAARNRVRIRVLLALLIVGNIVGIAVPAGLGWDFANFYDAGRRVAAGEADNLYRPTAPIAGQPPQGTLGFFGAPVSALLYTPLAMLVPTAALLAFKIQNAIAYAIGLWILFGLCCRLAGTDADRRSELTVGFLAIVLLFQPLWTVYRVGGQTTPTVFLLVVCALAAYLRGYAALAAAALVVATLIKPALVLMMAFLFLVSGVRFAVAGVAVYSLLGLASLAWLGTDVHYSFLELMTANSDRIARWFYNSSVYILPAEIHRWATGALAVGTELPRAPLLTMTVLGLRLFTAGACVAFVAAARREARRAGWSEAARRHQQFIAATLFFLLVSLTVWEHYLAILVLFVAYLLAVRDELSPPLQRCFMAIVLLGLGQNLILVSFVRDWIGVDSLVMLLVVCLLKSGPLLLTLLVLTCYRGQLLATYSGPSWARFARAGREA